MRCSSPSFWSASFLLLLAVASVLQAEKLVVARSVASSEYLQSRLVDGKLQPQTYVFMAGRYFAGNTHDNSLEKASFRTIAERLALDLRSQQFHPAASLPKADLLLIVHWGVTAGRNGDSVALAQGMDNLAHINLESVEAQQNLDEAIAADNLEEAARARGNLINLGNQARSESQELLRNQPSDSDDSAALLGLTAELKREDGSLFDWEQRKTLHQLTREECYFVIVMAYDAPTFLSRKILKRVWTLRASISSAGVNFPQALDRMTNSAGHYFGTRQDGVTFDYPGDRKRQERVTLGELQILGSSPDSSAATK